MRSGLRWAIVLAHLATAGSLAALVTSDALAQAPAARPWLGIAMEPDPGAPGVRLGHVVRGSPADKAGLREGDHILRVSGTAVSHGPDVVHAVSAFAPGDTLELAFVHAGGKEQTARVMLAPFPSQDEMMRMDLVGAFAPTWKDIGVVSGSFPASIGAMRGRVVLLDFWATWCAPCRVSIPKLDALQARFGAQGLSVLGVSTEDAQDVATFTQHMGMRYGVASDKHGVTTRSYGVASLPTLVIIDKRGVVRDVAIGFDPGSDARIEATVRSLLAEPAPTN
ncbi:MAG TPA: redoxin domain-containing protein [Polyangiaceae bacterium]